MKFQFVEDHKQKFAVKTMCRVLDVSEGGYYAWRKRPKSEREKQNAHLVEQIRQVYHDNRQSYGSPRIHVELKEAGGKCSRHSGRSSHESPWHQCSAQTTSGLHHR